MVTAQALKMHGGVPIEEIKNENISGVLEGLNNLKKHIENIRSFGQSLIVAFNKFHFDTEIEINLIQEFCKKHAIGFAINNAFSEGGKGAKELAQLVIDTIENTPSKKLNFTYNSEDNIQDKIRKVAQKIYGASTVQFSAQALKKLRFLNNTEMEKFPICIAKTQYSFSADSNAFGVQHGFEFLINDIVINRGAEFIVAIAGNMMRMPGLPKNPQALSIDLINGNVEGLS